MSMYDIPADKLIQKTAQELKKIQEIKAPSWASFVKTGSHKERPPVQEDWWHIRAASILRKVGILGPIGTNKLRRKYGGKKNRGHKPGKFYPGSSNITRKVLQQLEKAGLVKQTDIKHHKGRILTPKGKSLLHNISKNGK